ncbi:LOW QUALITY PROTEIN: hypothetical protein V2J09_001000, partial [Rumex salicifolius]
TTVTWLLELYFPCQLETHHPSFLLPVISCLDFTKSTPTLPSPIPDTVVWWSAQQGVSPNTGPKGSKIHLTAKQGLVLMDPQGGSLWSSPISVGSVGYYFLNDTRNLVVKGTNGGSLWESFGHPRGTFIPFQTMAAGGLPIFSKRSESNFTRGRFQLRFKNDGNLVLKTRSLNLVLKTRDQLYKGTVSYNGLGHMYILQKDGTKIELLSSIVFPTPGDDYYSEQLSTMMGFLFGILTPSIRTTMSILEGVTGACWYNSICTLSMYTQPNCTCPIGYSFIDPTDKFCSCAPNFNLGCEKDGEYSMEKLEKTDWPFNDHEYLKSPNINQCMDSCLVDCLCVASIFRDQGCWKKRFPLSNGQTNTSLGQTTTFIKLKNGNDVVCLKCNMSNPRRLVVKVWASSLAASVFIILVAIVCGAWYIQHRQYKGYDEVKKAHREYYNVHCFTYKELEEATDGFKHELGRGACVVVYKGVTGNDTQNTFFAVKKMDRAVLKEAEKDFKNETHHRNLVKLAGFCKEEIHHLLVYEFMSNGLFVAGEAFYSVLWKTRNERY